MALSVTTKTIRSEDALVDITLVAQIGRKLEAAEPLINAVAESA